MKYRIVELKDDIEKFIDFDRKISWDFVSEEIKRILSFEEYAARHRRLIEDIFKSNIENRIFLALNEENCIIGAVWIGIKMDTINYIPVCYIYDLEVAEEARGFGIGSSLLEVVENFCREHKIYRIALMTPVENADTVRWYVKKGFRIRRLYFEKTLEKYCSSCI